MILKTWKYILFTVISLIVLSQILEYLQSNKDDMHPNQERKQGYPTTRTQISRNAPKTYESKLCTEEEKLYQFENIDLIHPSSCDGSYLWPLIHLALPEATTFFDIGADRGYSSAQFFGFWAPGFGFNRIALREAIKKDLNAGFLNKTQDDNTHCADGLQDDTPSVCPGTYYALRPKKCSIRRPLKVYSRYRRALLQKKNRVGGTSRKALQ